MCNTVLSWTAAAAAPAPGQADGAGAAAIAAGAGGTVGGALPLGCWCAQRQGAGLQLGPTLANAAASSPTACKRRARKGNKR
eukprot:1114078-Pelagomonas_calceolata.AAC.1